jgi:intracellular sulfur oxidation DsrE/DsrF family protein/uncharacterized tellurite resistance protein B-like protein
MKHPIMRFFNRVSEEGPGASGNRNARDVRVATCALFLEMAHIDDTFTKEETEIILSILKEKYQLSDEHADHLLEEAGRELKESIDLWQFSKLINDNYSIQEKMEVIKTLWEIVFVDGKMDRYENYLMHKVATLLRLSNEKLIDAKLAVLHGSSEGSGHCRKETNKVASKSEVQIKTKVVFHLDWDEEKRLVMALNNITNLLKEIPSAEAAICLVANGSAVKLFHGNHAITYGSRVEELSGRGVRFLMCNNSLTNLNVDPGELLGGCEVIKAGVVELIVLQTDGYAYIKP